MVAKIQQLDKTIVTDFKVQVADIYMRQQQMRGAYSAKIPQNVGLIQADANVSQQQPVTITPINVAVLIQSWSPVILDLYGPNGAILDVPCTGLFILYGALSKVVVRVAGPTGARITYLSA